MADKPTLNRLFQGLHDELASQLEIARKALDHPTSKGTKTEDYWIGMFRKYLPRRYDVHRAFVIDSNDCCSQQIDVVVHDRQYSPFVLNLEGEYYVPAESVYAILEVKPKMDKAYIEYASEKVGSVRKLQRTSLPIKHAGGEYPAKPLHYILGGLVALESDWSPPFGEAFRKVVSTLSTDRRLDLGCAVRHGVFEVKYAPNEPAAIAAEQSVASLALFLLRFIARLQGIATVPCIDVLAYAANMKSESAD